MMMLQVVFTVLASAMLAGWLTVACRRPVKIALPTIVAELHYGRVLRVMALCFAMTPPTLLLSLIWRLSWRDEWTLAIAGASFLVLGLVPGCLLIEAARSRVILTDAGITRISAWRTNLTLAWGEIERVRYSALNRWYLVSAGNRNIRVSRMLVGVAAFIDLAKAKIPFERQGDLV